MDDLVLIGIVRKPRGPKGDLKVESFSDVPGRFSGLSSAYFRRSQIAQAIRHEIEKCEEVNGYVVLKLKGVDSFDEASEFVGYEMLVDQSERPELPQGTYFIDSLVGLTVKDLNGKEIGVVENVSSNGAQSLLSIRADNASDFVLPFVNRFIKSVDIKKSIIEVELIDGMLEGGIDEN